MGGKSVKQVYKNSRGEVYVREAPLPELKGSGAIVRTICSVIGSGSELENVRAIRARLRRGESLSNGPVTESPMSYQSCGRIEQLSDDLRDTYQLGDVVACAGSGFGNHGEYGYVPKNAMARVPNGLGPSEAAANNVGLTALHALRRADLRAGEFLAVIGLGMVGQFAIRLAVAFGGRAAGTDLLPNRLELARIGGAEVAVDTRAGDLVAEIRRRTDDEGADVVCECVSSVSEDLIHLAVRLLRPSGVLLLIGHAGYSANFSNARGDADPLVKEIDIRYVYGRGPGSRDPEWNNQGRDYPSRFVRWTAHSNLEALLHLQATGRVQIAPLLTHRLPVDRVSEAVDLLVDHPDQALGVVLTYD
jgi:threonine dehydrogenase-like Zn-dependent dehydrogenase